MTTAIAILALLVAAASMLLARRLMQDAEQMRTRLDRYNKTLFKAESELREVREQLANTAAELKVELMQRTGSMRFAPEMTAREALLLHPQVNEIFAGFHLGGCDDCAVEPDQTLAQISEARGLELGTLLENLNYLVADSNQPAGKDNGNGNGYSIAAPKRVKLPNVAFEM